MDSDTSLSVHEQAVEVIFEKEIEESSEEVPIEDWSSLEIDAVEHNPKRLLYEDGLYDPGSGDICTKYYAQSASSVLLHPYYKYPAITDPGIVDALLMPEPRIIYPDDGQKLYLAICKEMRQYPVRNFYRGLLENEINLQYYGVNPWGVRAMAIALENNNIVKTFNLTDNFLNTDACYHLGVMLSNNYTLQELDLTGCRIGPAGFQMLLSSIQKNNTLEALKLRGNELGDEAMEHLAVAIFNGLNITVIDLSRNGITGKGVASLMEAFETHNRFTHWNLSWNNLFSPGTFNFLSSLKETADHLVEIDLSWNSLSGPRVAQGISYVLRIRTLQHLNLSNNRLESQAIQTILVNLTRARALQTLNLSYNPMTPTDALLVLNKLQLRTVRVRNVYMDNVNVKPIFLKLLDRIMEEKPYLVVTYGYVMNNYTVKGPDARDLVLNRAQYLCNKQRGIKVDIALVALQLQKEKLTIMSEKTFIAEVTKRFKAPLDEDLITALVHAFPGEQKGKGITINIDHLVDFVRRKWPDKELPPTPPPTPPVEPEVTPQKTPKKKKK